MKEHVVEALAKKWKLPEDIDDQYNPDTIEATDDTVNIADKLADKNTSLKKKMKLLEAEMGRSKESTIEDNSDDTLANDSGSNTSLKDNTIIQGENTFWSETFLHKIS